MQTTYHQDKSNRKKGQKIEKVFYLFFSSLKGVQKKQILVDNNFIGKQYTAYVSFIARTKQNCQVHLQAISSYC